MPVHKRPHFERFTCSRIVARAEALDALQPADGAFVMRFASDEILVSPPLSDGEIAQLLAGDPHAIVIADSAFSGVWLDEEQALALLERLAEWEMPSARPAFAQGAVAGIACKLWFAQGRVLFLVQSPYAEEMEARLS